MFSVDRRLKGSLATRSEPPFLALIVLTLSTFWSARRARRRALAKRRSPGPARASRAWRSSSGWRTVDRCCGSDQARQPRRGRALTRSASARWATGRTSRPPHDRQPIGTALAQKSTPWSSADLRCGQPRSHPQQPRRWPGQAPETLRHCWPRPTRFKLFEAVHQNQTSVRHAPVVVVDLHRICSRSLEGGGSRRLGSTGDAGGGTKATTGAGAGSGINNAVRVSAAARRSPTPRHRRVECACGSGRRASAAWRARAVRPH